MEFKLLRAGATPPIYTSRVLTGPRPVCSFSIGTRKWKPGFRTKLHSIQSAISPPRFERVDESQILTLDSIRHSLIRQEDSIIFSLLERAQYCYNANAYDKNVFTKDGSLVEFMVRETEKLHAQVGRYKSPDEHPFFPEDLPEPMLPPMQYPKVLHPIADSININKKIWGMYFGRLLPRLVKEGDDGNCGSSAVCDTLSLGLSSENDPHWWRTMLYGATFPAFIVMLGMQFAVESPRWLCKVGRIDDAIRVVSSLWSESKLQNSIEEILSVIKDDSRDSDSGWLELLDEPHNKVACIGGSLFVLQQFSGINAVLYFSSLTFKDVGITSGAWASLLVGITNFAGALSALYLMDKQGRQRLLIGSYMGMACSMFLIVYSIASPGDEGLGQILSVLGSVMYIFTFAIGAGPVTGLIIPELSSSQTRAKIMGFSFSVHWVCNFLVGLNFLEMVERFGVAPVYATFGSVSLLAAVFARYFIVETKGRSLEEIELSLSPGLRIESMAKESDHDQQKNDHSSR